MNTWIELLNGGMVGLFGSILAASFCGIGQDRRRSWYFGCGMTVIFLLQYGMSFFYEFAFLQRIYPLYFHLPCWILLATITRKCLWSLISILCAYLCCQLRHWFALLLNFLLSGGETAQNMMELVITIPLLLALLHFISPALRQVSGYSRKMQCQFAAIPAIYYGFDYLTCVYTRLLLDGTPVAVEFMPFICCIAYLVFLLYNVIKEEERHQLEQVQKTLDLQLKQAVREINLLRETQEQARRYRHDLRHHLQYLSACIQNGEPARAQAYIAGIFQEIEGQKIGYYCENEAANLVFSAFVSRAAREGIAFEIQGNLPTDVAISEQDLCVLLSNALENALHACQSLDIAQKGCTISVQMYQRDGKVFLQVRNPCEETVSFRKGLPVSDQPEHGIGIQSICAIVERYGGIYTFCVQNGSFVLRVSL